MAEPQRLTIDDLCRSGVVELQTGPFGSQLHAHDYVDDGVPVVPTEAIKNRRIVHENLPQISAEKASELARHRLRAGDILFARRGVQATGQSALVRHAEDGFLCGTGAIRLRVMPGNGVLASNFLSHVLMDRASRDWIRHNAIGATMPNLNEGIIRRFALFAPAIDDQARIASLLDALDDKIELNRQMNETLEAMARAIFRDWFVDFGPTRAKMKGREPYLAPDIWSLFPDRLDDAGKPEGWNVEPLGDHIQNYDSKRVPLSGAERAKRKGSFPYHGATSVMDHIDDYLFDGIYLLVGEDGSVVNENGRAYTQYVWGRFWVNNHAHVLQGKGTVSTEQLLVHFSCVPVAPYITGAVQMKLSQGRMNSMPFMYGGREICESFGQLVAPYFSKLRANDEETRTLTQMRDLLLPKLMSGEIRIRDAEKIAGEAA